MRARCRILTGLLLLGACSSNQPSSAPAADGPAEVQTGSEGGAPDLTPPRGDPDSGPDTAADGPPTDVAGADTARPLDAPAVDVPARADAATERPSGGELCQLGGSCCTILIPDAGASTPRTRYGCFDPALACDRRVPRGVCVPCGESGGPCCDFGQACVNPNEACLKFPGHNVCARCGGDGELCCQENDACRTPSSLCETPVGTYDDPKRCIPCGEERGKCCGEEQRCNRSDLICDLAFGRSVCVKCGTAPPPDTTSRTPCCAGNRCTDGSCCMSWSDNPVSVPHCMSPHPALPSSGAPLTCGSTASHGGCGGLGQLCCGIAEPDVYAIRYCVASGTKCQQTMDPNRAWRCVECGKAGQPCCWGSTIANPYPPCEGTLKCGNTPTGQRCIL